MRTFRDALRAGCIAVGLSAGNPVVSPVNAQGLGGISPDSLALLATASLRRADTAAAISAYRRAIELDPKHRSAGLLITLLYDAGQTADAIALGKSYYRGSVRNPQAVFRYGWVLGYLWENERADTLFKELVELDRGGIYEAWGNGERAYLARARGDMDAAIGFMKLAMVAQPTDMFSRVGLANMYLDAHRAAEALPILEAAVAQDSLARGYGQVPAILLLASAYRQVGDSSGHRRTVERIRLRMDQLTPQRRAQFLAIAGDRAAALDIVRLLPVTRLYGSPNPGDHLLSSLRGAPEYEAFLKKSRDDVTLRRKAVGLSPRP